MVDVIDSTVDYAAQASDVMNYIQSTFYLPKEKTYAHSITDRHSDFMWGNGVTFTALLGAARHDPMIWTTRLTQFFTAMDRYWDAKEKIPGYEPLPTNGKGNDKYYDDNAWMVIAFVEAYEQTKDRRFLRRAEQTLDFVLSGWDEQLGGGIWWHETHKNDAKNTCVNAPAAVSCLRVARYESPAKQKTLQAFALKLSDWTTKTFQRDDGLFADSITVSTQKYNEAKLTYNTALMIRTYLGLYRTTSDDKYLGEAKRCADAADGFVDKKTAAYRDAVKWSHLQVEADLEIYRMTNEKHYLRRAVDNARHEYETWKANKPSDVIDSSAVARTLWLMADMQSVKGLAFWKSMDAKQTPSR